MKKCQVCGLKPAIVKAKLITGQMKYVCEECCKIYKAEGKNVPARKIGQ